MARPSRFFPLGPVLLVFVLCGAGAAPASAAPRNDDFADALPIRVGQTLQGTTRGATEQDGEPIHAGEVGGEAGVWYRLRVARKVTVLLNTCLPDGDPAIAVYTGRSLRSLEPIDFSTAGCSGRGSRVAFTARPGVTYRIVVTEWDANRTGHFTLGAKSITTPRNDDFVDAIPLKPGTSMRGTTRNATLELGEPWVFFAHRTVWFKLRVAAPTRLRLSVCSAAPSPKLNVYTGRAVSALTKAVGDARRCASRFDAHPGTTYRIQIAWSHSRGDRFTLSARDAGSGE